MTQRLYYTDAYLQTFDAVVAETLIHDGRPAVILDRTAFYPTSGGQRFDVGRLENVPVVDVVDGEDDRIVHVLDAASTEAPLEVGRLVRGEIDWRRRFDHMQQHTGQHILSAAFVRCCQARTESFHMGALTSTIDLDCEPAAASVEAAETESNRVIWEDRPVTVRFVSAEHAQQLSLRKPSARGGELRLIDVEDYDLSACGGAHTARTGAVGGLGVVSTERFRGGLRVEFVCGGRLLQRYRLLRDAAGSAARALGSLPEDLPALVARLQGDLKDARRELRAAETRLIDVEADQLLARGSRIGDVTVVLDVIPGADAATLKQYASTVASRSGVVAALLATPPAQDPSSTLLIAIGRSANVACDAGAVLRSVFELRGGRGGGKPDLAQGGGVRGPVEEALASVRTRIEAALAPTSS